MFGAGGGDGGLGGGRAGLLSAHWHGCLPPAPGRGYSGVLEGTTQVSDETRPKTGRKQGFQPDFRGFSHGFARSSI